MLSRQICCQRIPPWQPQQPGGSSALTRRGLLRVSTSVALWPQLLYSKDGLRRALLRLADDSDKEARNGIALVLPIFLTTIRSTLPTLQPSQLVAVANVVIQTVSTTRKELTAGGESDQLQDQLQKCVMTVRLALLAYVFRAVRQAAPRQFAAVRDSFLADHLATLKQYLTLMANKNFLGLMVEACDSLFSPEGSYPDPSPIPLRLALPPMTLLTEYVAQLAEGATDMSAEGWRRAVDLCHVAASAALVASKQPDRSVGGKDVKRLVEQHLFAHVDELVRIILTAEGVTVGVAAVTLSSLSGCAFALSAQWRSLLSAFPLSSWRPLLNNPQPLAKAAAAIPTHDIERSVICDLLAVPAKVAVASDDIDTLGALAEALCRLLLEPLSSAGVKAIVTDLKRMLECGDGMVARGKATSNSLIDQIAHCEAVQQLRRRRDLSIEVTSFIQSLPKTVKVCSSSAATDRSHRPAKHKTAAHTHQASGPPPPPRSPSPQPSSPVDADALVDGLLSDDIETFTSAGKAIADQVTTALAKRLAVRVGKEKKLFRRLLMRLVDSGNEKCQLAAADLLVSLFSHGLLEHMAPSDGVRAVQDIFDILTWGDLEEGGVGGDLGGEVDSIISSAIVEASSGDEPLPRAVDVVTYARLRLIEGALQQATSLEAAGRLQLRESFFQTHQTTLRQPPRPQPFGRARVLLIFVESLKQLRDEQPARTRLLVSPLIRAADYLWDSPCEGIVEEWPAIKAALNTHVYAHLDTLVSRIKASDPSSFLGFATITIVGALFETALILCVRKNKGGPLQQGDFGKYIEQAGVVRTLAAAPPPMQPLRALVLDATLGDRVANALDMDCRAHEDPRNFLADYITAALVTSLVIPAMAMIDDGEAGRLIESRFVSTLIPLLGRAERTSVTMIALCMRCVMGLSQRDRKVLGTDGLAKVICDVLLKDAQGQLLLADVLRDTDRKTAVDILKSIVSYCKSLVVKGAPNPIVGQILQFKSVKALCDPTSGIEVSRHVSDFLDALAQQHQKDTKAQPKTAAQPTISAAQLAAQDAKAKRMEKALLEQERREKEAKARKDQKANKGKGKTKRGKATKGGKGQQLDAAGGDEASPFDPIMEPSVPSTAASTSRASAADEASQLEPSSWIADTSGASGVSSVSVAGGSDLPGDGGDSANSAAVVSDDDEDGDAMLINSAFGQHARQQRNQGKKKKTEGKHNTRPTPTPTSQPSQPSRPSLPPALRTNQTGQIGRPPLAANEDRYRGGTAPIRMPAPIPLSSAHFPKGRFKMSPGNGGLAPPVPKRPMIPRPLLSDDDSPSGWASPPLRPMGGRGAGRGRMTMFAHRPPPPPSIPYSPFPSAEELRNRSLLQHTGQDDQQQPTRAERPSLSTAGPSLSRFFAHAPIGPGQPAAAAAAGGPGAGGLSADLFYDSEGDDMYCVPPPPAFSAPPAPHSPIDPSAFHRMGPSIPVSYNDGPQPSGAPSDPFGIPYPLPSGPPAPASAAVAGGGLSADPFYGYDSGDDDMYVPPPPPIFEYEEEGYQPPSSSSPADPFAAAQTAGTMQGGNVGASTGFGAGMGAGASGSEELVDQLCRQLEQKDQEAKRRAREAKRRAQELQEAREKEQEAKRNEEALIRQLQEAQWTIAKMAAQQSSHHHHQHQPSSSSSSAPPPPSSSFAHPHPSTHANTTMHQHQQQHDSGNYDDCDDRKAAWQRELSRVKAENDRRREENEVARRLNETRSQEEQISLVKLLDEPEYTCEHCKAKVEFAGTVDDCIKWVARPFK
ncbi:unnamed protein product [Vitrella brassicaformis CCMP3155]|uniref:Uncharacterized protein n=1 Tax=Vitrella brassicaformis (strain CCMP3155) TaxID=1169540 RepID=A0A0G4GKM5_VITBC|nr:unnamed protein product [Vitrella brassicaformis CCMP3155]|eukprot:CEM30579.1 unnamed protein product [Vitrella brassicaformis CCMP3155]